MPDSDNNSADDLLANSKTILINGEKALVYDKPINPKDYKTYDEYLEALRVREEFHERVKEVDRIIKESKTDEEYRRRMKRLGFDTG